MNKLSTDIDSTVVFVNSQGKRNRGTLVHVTRSSIIFEVYNPYSILQLSETLREIRVSRGERVVYHGKAVVTNMVLTGLMVIVSASLVDAWSDLTGLTAEGSLQEETQRFVQDWQKSYQIIPEYSLSVVKIRNFLGEMNRWLEMAELDYAENHQAGDESFNEAIYEEIKIPVLPKVEEFFEEFEDAASQVPPEQLDVCKAYAHKELHPLVLCSPFVHRTFIKPLGYAGDYEMVNMMLGTSSDVPTRTYARLVNDYSLSCAPAIGHRHRIAMLEERLRNEAVRVTRQEERAFSVLNVACGPAVEVQHFIENVEISSHCTVHLMDFNDVTLQHTESRIKEAIAKSGHTPMVKMIHKSVDTLLKEVHDQKTDIPVEYDMVYCAGLFDYLPQQVCKLLVDLYYKWTRPGGLITVTNLHPRNPVQNYMEHILEWYLVYRDKIQMKDLSPNETKCDVVEDPTGTQVFLDIRKSKK